MRRPVVMAHPEWVLREKGSASRCALTARWLLHYETSTSEVTGYITMNTPRARWCQGRSTYNRHERRSSLAAYFYGTAWPFRLHHDSSAALGPSLHCCQRRRAVLQCP